MKNQPQPVAEFLSYSKRLISESFGGQSIYVGEEYVEIHEMFTEKKIYFSEITKVRAWLGGDPYALGKSRSLTLFLLLDVKDRDKPVEIKQGLHRIMYTARYKPLDMSLVIKIKEKNPNAVIAEPLIEYIRTQDIKYLFDTNQIPSQTMKPILYIAAVLGGLLILTSLVRLLIRFL